MRVRKVARQSEYDLTHDEIIWFGSYGTNSDGTAKFIENKESFSEDKAFVADALQQKLNILKSELWWNINFGLPLLEKVHSKQSLDIAVTEIIMSQEGVKDITEFDSSVGNHHYSAQITIESEYGTLNLSI